MSQFEILATVISIISAVIAVTSLIRTRETAKEQLRLEQITADLSEKQLALLKDSELEKTQPKLRMTLTKIGNSYRFIIINRGEGSAYNLGLKLIDCDDSPLSTGEVSEKLPIPELKSNARIRLLASIHMGSRRTYHFKLNWTNKDGDKSFAEDHYVTL